jgi:tetratricopeptide (TPR) repeat protein
MLTINKNNILNLVQPTHKPMRFLKPNRFKTNFPKVLNFGKVVSPFYPPSVFLLIFTLFITSCKNEPKQEAPKFGKTGIPQIDALTEKIFKDTKNANLYYQRAKLFNENGAQGGYDMAIEDMRYALSLDSTNTDYYHFLSDVYLDYAQSRLAVVTMEKAAALAPTKIPTLLKLSQVYLITKQYGLSLKTTDRILKQDPQNSEAFFLLGMVMKEQNDEAKATIAFQKAVDLDSDNKDAFIELGKMYTNKGNPLALKYFDNALILDSLDFNARMSKAYYFQTKNQLNEAILEYKKILSLDPRYENALFNMGLMYLDSDSLDQAYYHFNIVINEAPTFYKAYYYRGLIREKQGGNAAALKDYKQSLEFNSTYEKALEAVKRLEKK